MLEVPIPDLPVSLTVNDDSLWWELIWLHATPVFTILAAAHCVVDLSGRRAWPFHCAYGSSMSQKIKGAMSMGSDVICLNNNRKYLSCLVKSPKFVFVSLRLLITRFFPILHPPCMNVVDGVCTITAIAHYAGNGIRQPRLWNLEWYRITRPHGFRIYVYICRKRQRNIRCLRR